MGVFGGARVIRCPAGEWTSLISNFGSGIPARWTITFEPAVPGGPVRGTFREQRFFWFLPQAPLTGPIEARMVFSRYWINAIYRLSVRAEDGELTARIEGGVLG